LKGYVGGMLKTKNTPRLMFVDAEKRKMEYAREEEAYKEIAEARRRGGVEDEDTDNDDNGDGAIPRERDDGLSTTVM